MRRLATLIHVVAATTAWHAADEFARLHAGAPPTTRRDRVRAEIERSVAQFDARPTPAATEALVETLLAPELRDSAVFIVDGKIFATAKFVKSSKKRGHATMLASAIRDGGLPNVAWAHVPSADGSALGPPCINGTGYAVPTTVIAKREGYAQCGVLVPNPYFGRGDVGGAWRAAQARTRAAAAQHPTDTRDARAFWRGSCLNHETREGRTEKNKPGKAATPDGSSPWGETTCERDAGNRARMLAASLTAARPDLFDVRCNRVAPPSNFSCVRGGARKEHDAARAAILNAPATITDATWHEPHDYARYRYLVNLPGETSGSYSRNLNHLWATGAVVLLWNAKIVEFYYPALAVAESVGVVDRASAADLLDALNADAAARARLAEGALGIDRDFVCPECLHAYLRDVATAVRERANYASVLDDGRAVAALASAAGACEDVVRVDVAAKKVYGETQWTAVSLKESICSAFG